MCKMVRKSMRKCVRKSMLKCMRKYVCVRVCVGVFGGWSCVSVPEPLGSLNIILCLLGEIGRASCRERV